MLLLPNGTVMAQGGGVTNNWYKLTPDSTGNYANGTWSTLAPMGTQRLYFASDVLSNDEVFVAGGEYSGPSGTNNDTNSGEIYNMLNNRWAPIATPPVPNLGDVISQVLPNGTILVRLLERAPNGNLTPARTPGRPAQPNFTTIPVRKKPGYSFSRW